MILKSRTCGLALVHVILLAAIPTCTARSGNEVEHKSNPTRPAIYDTKADGEKQIADALKIAASGNKRVLLQFGANWCVWCHRLHGLLKEDARVEAKLKESYELVLIDVDTVDGKQHNEKVDAKYGNPMKLGLPVLVVLDSDGKQLTTQSTEVFEVEDHHDPVKILAFLEKWALPRN